ncbi:HAD family hydrolase, partial [Cellulomonas citrea]|uniref:HAD family hydrolase n=1 Tax=Cellulomonas citrea TaxID=1909423 RepID=UPI001358CE18
MGPQPRPGRSGLNEARPAAVLFDLDGTLVDSEPVWAQATGELAARYDVPWSTADDEAIIGLAIPDVAALLIGRGVPLDSPTIEHWLNDRVAQIEVDGPPWRDGARALLAALAAAQVPTALVTMTYRSLATSVAAAAPAGSLTVVVAGDDVERGKPDPQAYLLAAAGLGVAPADCVAVEDSVPGITSALASGALTYAVQPATVLPAQQAAHPRLRR